MDIPNFYKDNWEHLGLLAEPLVPGRVFSLHLDLDNARRLRGKVTDPAGKGLEGLRVQVWYRMPNFVGLKNAYGYSVTHTGPDGRFEAEGVGPGPYRVTAGDIRDRLAEVKDVPEGEPDLRIIWPYER